MISSPSSFGGFLIKATSFPAVVPGRMHPWESQLGKITMINEKGFLEEWEKLSYLGHNFQKENKHNRHPLYPTMMISLRYIYT